MKLTLFFAESNAVANLKQEQIQYMLHVRV